MAWVGYYEFGGTEIINAARVERYAKVLGAFKAVYHADDLPLVLGDDPYSTPMQDEAPWWDPDDANTNDFYGVYPLDVTGLDDSTFTANVTESTGNGGTVSGARFATKAVVFSVALIGGSEAACEAGFRWLKQVLTSTDCASVGTCGGLDLCFLASEPMVDQSISGDPTDCWDPIARSLHRVATTVAPNVNSKASLTHGGEVWLVGFTLVAGNPFQFGWPNNYVRGFGDVNTTDPYLAGTPDDAVVDLVGFVQDDPFCPKPTYNPINDPLFPAIITPPSAPNVVTSGFNFPVNYRRRQFTIERDIIPSWGEVVPFIRLRSPNKESRNVRVRFYADPFGLGDPNSDPCNFCGDIVVSYIPAGGTIVLDGTDEIVYAEDVVNGRRQASHLVFGSDGGPFDWPQLSCGFGYVVTMDTPQSGGSPIMDLTLYQRVS